MESLFERFIRNFREEINHRNILQWGEFLASMNSTAFEVEHTGTLFKLYSLYSYLRFPYLHIMMSRRQKGQFPQKIVYLDLFSGNGLNKVNTEGRSHYICGSGILALLASYVLSEKRRYTCYFDHMLLIDSDNKNNVILLDRCKSMLKNLGIESVSGTDNDLTSKYTNITTIHGDATKSRFMDKITDWLDDIWDKHSIHIMLFVDPPSPSTLNVSILKRLLVYPGDFLMLLHPGTFAEMVSKRRYNIETIQTMTKNGNKKKLLFVE